MSVYIYSDENRVKQKNRALHQCRENFRARVYRRQSRFTRTIIYSMADARTVNGVYTRLIIYREDWSRSSDCMCVFFFGLPLSRADRFSVLHILSTSAVRDRLKDELDGFTRKILSS